MLETIRTEIESTRSMARLETIAKTIWAGWGAGSLSDDEAGLLGACIEAQRASIRGTDTVAGRAPAVPRRVSVFPQKRRRAVSPDREASIRRRRTLAAAGVLPPALACLFTTGELAALVIVADAFRAVGRCDLSIGEIAARAGVCETVARGAIREAAKNGLVLIEERRRHCAPNLPNVVRIISRAWRTWLDKRPRRHRPAQGGGFGNVGSTDTEFHPETSKRPLGMSLSIRGGG